MADFSIKPAELAAKAEELSALNEQLRAKCAEYAEKGRALAGTFEGDTANAFLKEVEINSSKMGEFIKLVNEYAVTMNEDAQTYIKAENDAYNTVNK